MTKIKFIIFFELIELLSVLKHLFTGLSFKENSKAIELSLVGVCVLYGLINFGLNPIKIARI